MVLLGVEDMRDVVAFPKVASSSDLMSHAPSVVEQAQLDELGIAVVAKEKPQA